MGEILPRSKAKVPGLDRNPIPTPHSSRTLRGITWQVVTNVVPRRFIFDPDMCFGPSQGVRVEGAYTQQEPIGLRVGTGEDV